jgi:hypothetical protein
MGKRRKEREEIEGNTAPIRQFHTGRLSCSSRCFGIGGWNCEESPGNRRKSSLWENSDLETSETPGRIDLAEIYLNKKNCLFAGMYLSHQKGKII